MLYPFSMKYSVTFFTFSLKQVYEKIGLSPGRYTKTHSEKSEQVRKRQKDVQTAVKFKRRRIELKENRYKSNSSQEVREGASYKTNIGLTVPLPDVEEIPGPVTVPLRIPIQHDNVSFVVFDLETTGLDSQADIVQIAVVCGDKKFNCYIFPSKPMSFGAEMATHITVNHTTGKMFYKGAQIESVSTQSGLSDFLDWLKSIMCPVLVCHNGYLYDSRVLCRSLHKYNMLSEFRSCCEGFIDTLSYFRNMYVNQNSYKQEALVNNILGKHYNAHNAQSDVEALQELFLHVEPKQSIKYSFTIENILDAITFQEQKKTYILYNHWICQPVICTVMFTVPESHNL
ncbi:DNA polymerase III PolC-type-like [Ptychodera flava]|uniref:DNA polymerase III PolC-type-like n=1 Tax=Ptychodera flava TaxID=63121 RepID=UPI00396A75E7